MNRPLTPSHGLKMHAPPDTDELHRTNPRGVVDSARVVEVEHDAARTKVREVIREDKHAPRRLERSSAIGFYPILPRREIGANR